MALTEGLQPARPDAVQARSIAATAVVARFIGASSGQTGRADYTPALRGAQTSISLRERHHARPRGSAAPGIKGA
jgi:hypothetical protein